MPKADVQKCLSCGAPLSAPPQGGKVKCEFCGAINVVQAHEKVKGDEIICPECGAANPKAAKHCGRCGIKLEFNCPRCGALNSYGTVFCVQCGLDIPKELERQKAEIKRQQDEERRRQEEMNRRIEEDKKKRQRRNRVTVLIAAGLVGLLAICGVITLIYISIANSPSRLSTKTAVARSTSAAISAAQTATVDYLLLFHDDFSYIGSGWGTSSSENGSVGYENDAYRIHVIKPNWEMYYSLNEDLPPDVSIEVDVTKIGGPDNNDFGIACRMVDTLNFYYFAVSSDGYAGIMKMVQGQFEIISSSDGKWYQASSVYKGDVMNHIRADCVGENLTLYVNGVKTLMTTDSSYTSGDVGLVAGSGDEGGTDVQFDNFYVLRP